MAQREILLPRDSQPQEAVGVDWENPIAAQCQGVFVPSASGMVGYLPSGIVFPTSDTGTYRIGQSGISRDYSGTQRSRFAFRPEYSLASAMTLVLLFDLDVLSNYGGLVSFEQTDSTKGWELRLGVGTSDSRISMERNNTTSKQYVALASGNAIAAGSRDAFLAVTYPSADIDSGPTFYINGVSFEALVGAGSGTGPQTTATSANLEFSARADGATRLDGAITFAALFARALSEDELLSLRANPWQLFAPRSIPIPVSAGGASAVSSDSSAAYSVVGSAQSSTSAAYSVIGSVQSSSSATYSVLTSAQQDAAATYSVVGSVAADRAASYSVVGSVQSDTSASYSVLTDSAVISSSTAEYNVVGTVSADRAASYGVSASVQADRSASYSLLAAIQSDSAASWRITGVVQSDRAANYSITGVVQADTTASWQNNVAPSSATDLILKILSNRQELNAATGKFTLYDDDSTTILYQSNAWADAAGTIPYSGGVLARIDRLT